MRHNKAHPAIIPICIVLGTILLLFVVPQTRDLVAGFFKGAFGGRNNFNFFSTLSRFSILLGMAMSVLMSFRAGLLNIGAEGQLVLGGLSAALVGVYFPGSGVVVAIFAAFAGMSAGAALAVLAGFLERAAKLPLLIGTLLLNYPAVYFASYCVSHPFRDVASGATQSHRIFADARLPRFPGTLLDYGILIITTVAVVLILLDRISVFGYRTRMQGYSIGFARASGFPTRRLYYQSLLISGMIAGLTGFIAVFGLNQRYIDGMLTIPLYAWTGIAAVLLAGITPWLTPITTFFFAALATGAIGMERSAGIPREIGQILQACIVLYLAGVSGKLLSTKLEKDR